MEVYFKHERINMSFISMHISASINTHYSWFVGWILYI